MNLLRRWTARSGVRAVRILAVVSCIGLFVCGCSKDGGGPATTMGAKAFDSAPADLKERWQMAAASAAKSDYLGAVTNLAFIFGTSQTLTPDQDAALRQAWADIGNRAFQAANNGDKAALQAVTVIRTSDVAKGKGDR